MEYSDGYLREQLPTEEPPFELVPTDVSDEVAGWVERIDMEERGLIARSTRWTYAIFSEFELRQVELERGFSPWMFIGPHLSRVSVGLFDPEAERGFGIIIDVPPWPGPSFIVVDSLLFPRLGARFPLALRQSQIELHLHHPANATSACWAQCNSTHVWGVLTAGHAVRSNRQGRPVALKSGDYGILYRSYYQPIDAAFVRVPNPPSNPNPLSVLSFPAAGQPVTVECQAGPEKRTIFAANDNMGVTNTRNHAVMFHLDEPCNRGDSGSLVRMLTGEAAGIYAGKQETPRRPSGVCGLVQNFEQAIFALNVTPYL
jgi:hypothetical protein